MYGYAGDALQSKLRGLTAVGVAAAVLAGTAAAATAQARDLKMAFFASPKHHIWAKLMMPWANDLKAANVGINVVGFPGSQIGGSPPGAFKRVVNGIADVEFGLQGYTSTVFPKTMVVEIPLQWGSPTDATKALWRIYDKHLSSEYQRVEVLGMWVTDVPVLMTNKVVRHPDDLKGLKLRTPSRDQAAIIKGLGATPVAMPMPQTYGAIEKGVVDGALVGISVVNSFKLAEVVKNYVIDLPMGYSPQMMVMNKKTYAGLSDDQKKAVEARRGLALSLKGAKLYEAAREAGLKTVRTRPDTKVTALSQADKAAWNARFETIVDDWVARYEKTGLPYRQILADYLAKGS